MLLHKTEWLGKGKPPIVTVPELPPEEPVTEPELLPIIEETAAKEETIIEQRIVEEGSILEESPPLAADPIALLEPAPASIALSQNAGVGRAGPDPRR